MKLTTLQDSISRGLGIVAKAVASRSSLPVLSNVLVDGGDNAVRLTTTDLEIALTVEIGAKVEEPGWLTLPHKTLADMVGTMPAEPLTIETTDATAKLKCGRTKATIKGILADEFPTIQRLDRSKATAIDAQALKAMLKAVLYAAATDDTRPILRSVYLRIGDGMARCAASDGFRVAECSRPMDGPTRAAVLPVRAAEALVSILDGEDEALVQIEDVRAIVRVGSVELVAQLIDGPFPSYGAIVPKSHKTTMTVVTSEAVRGVKTVNVIARERANTLDMTITPATDDGPGRVVLAGIAAETGDSLAEVDAVVEGPALDVTLNAVYLRQALDSIGAPNAVVSFGTATSPVMVRPAGDDNQWCVIMPMQTPGQK